jgi:hypothetical protein
MVLAKALKAPPDASDKQMVNSPTAVLSLAKESVKVASVTLTTVGVLSTKVLLTEQAKWLGTALTVQPLEGSVP